MSGGNFLGVPDGQGLGRSRSLSSSLNTVPNPTWVPRPSQLVPSQSLYRHDGMNIWRPVPVSSPGAVATDTAIPGFQVITWNIEFSAPQAYRRTNGILDYIWSHTLASTAQTLGRVPTILLFQEVCAEAFSALLTHPFIQNNYDLTDISGRNFDSHYGTITCIPKSLTRFVVAVNRTPLENTHMGRDALVVDLDLPHFPSFRHSFPCRPTISRVRICNTHLESLRGHGDLARPQQLRQISHLLLSADGGLVAGDMNAIAPTDDRVPSALGLSDAWEVMHPQAPLQEGYTWGYQPPSRRYSPGRLDKVLFLGKLTPVSIERFGVGRCVEIKWSDVWLSDHYGLVARFSIG